METEEFVNSSSNKTDGTWAIGIGIVDCWPQLCQERNPLCVKNQREVSRETPKVATATLGIKI